MFLFRKGLSSSKRFTTILKKMLVDTFCGVKSYGEIRGGLERALTVQNDVEGDGTIRTDVPRNDKAHESGPTKCSALKLEWALKLRNLLLAKMFQRMEAHLLESW